MCTLMYRHWCALACALGIYRCVRWCIYIGVTDVYLDVHPLSISVYANESSTLHCVSRYRDMVVGMLSIGIVVQKDGLD